MHTDMLKMRIRQLEARLDLAIKQRDGFAANYHAVMRVPFQERNEIIEECNADIEKENGEPKDDK